MPLTEAFIFFIIGKLTKKNDTSVSFSYSSWEESLLIYIIETPDTQWEMTNCLLDILDIC